MTRGYGEKVMNTQIGSRRVYISGQQIEVWENPDLPFRCTYEEIKGYAERQNWVMLFNALVLSAEAPQS